MSAIGKGASILSHGGRSYGIMKVKRQSPSSEIVFQPQNDGMFSQVQSQVSESYQIYEMPTQPSADSLTTALPQYTATTVVPGRYAKPVRQQPPGLRMKFMPFGTVVNEDDSAEETQSFRMPRRVPSPPLESPKKKKKKQHRSSSNRNNEADQMDIDEPQGTEGPMSQPLASSQMSVAGSQSKAERKARKEEKERKKQKKREKKASDGA